MVRVRRSYTSLSPLSTPTPSPLSPPIFSSPPSSPMPPPYSPLTPNSPVRVDLTGIEEEMVAKAVRESLAESESVDR